MGSGQVFHNLTFKRVTALRKDSLCHLLFFKPLFLATCKLKQSLTMIVRIKLLQKFYLVCSDINGTLKAKYFHITPLVTMPVAMSPKF